jgi:N-acetylmuramoyl-L-alanine amidase
MSIRLLALLITLMTTLMTTTIPALAASRPFKVVIDPGHGGTDFGTIYHNGDYPIAEKNVTLMIARQVALQLRAHGIDATLTRRDDRELPLGKRTELANRMAADVFLSIHMNSAPGAELKGAEGVETYILNNATDASSRRLAYLENTVISRDGIKTPQQEDVALILRDMRLDANLSESKRLACAIQNSLVGPRKPGAPRSHQKSRGVKQALFHVLLGADMPSVLVEAGFLSNPRDRAIVLSAEGRKAMATSIARAIEQYRRLKGTRAATVALSRCRVR